MKIVNNASIIDTPFALAYKRQCRNIDSAAIKQQARRRVRQAMKADGHVEIDMALFDREREREALARAIARQSNVIKFERPARQFLEQPAKSFRRVLVTYRRHRHCELQLAA